MRPLGRIGDAAIAAIAERPDPLDEVAGIGPHRPFVAVGADLALDVEVVEQHELADQGVVVGRDGLGEQADARLAVAFGHVAEDLVVGAVLLDDVDDVLDRRGVADLRGNRVPGRGQGAADAGRIAPSQRAALVDRLRVGRHLAWRRAWGSSTASPGRGRRCTRSSGLRRGGSPAAGRRGWPASSTPCRWPRRSSCRRGRPGPRSDTSRPG